MSLPFATDDVTVLSAPALTRDAYGNEVRDWAAALRTTVRGVVQASGRGFTVTSTEDRAGRDQVATTYRVLLPPGTAVTAYDRLEWSGFTFEVSGDPTPWKGPTKALDHISALVQVVSG